MDTYDVGRQLRAARIAAGLTMRELAEKAGRSHQLVEKVEYGQNTTLDTLEAFASAADAVLVVSIQPAATRPQGLPPADRLAVASRLMGILPRLPDDVVDGLLHDIAQWETQHPPKS